MLVHTTVDVKGSTAFTSQEIAELTHVLKRFEALDDCKHASRDARSEPRGHQ